SPMELSHLARTPTVERARTLLREHDADTLATMIELAEIPAPPFGESERGQRLRERFAEVGLADVVTDEVGNVLARLPGDSGAGLAPVIVAAHLDTVFPPETDVTVRTAGGRLVGPGIADNARGLAALLALARAMVEAGIRTRRPVVFAGTVGEE